MDKTNQSSSTIQCAHCGLPVPKGLVQTGADKQFCCAGCRIVYDTIQSCGLDSFYRLREIAGESLQPARPTHSKYQAFDAPEFTRLYVQPLSNNAHSIELLLEGVTCSACIWLIEKLPEVLPGVIEARLNLRAASVRITWDDQRVKLSQIAQMLDRLGHPPHPAKGQGKKAMVRRESRRMLIHIGIAGALMGNIMLIALAMYAGDVSGMEPIYRTFFRWLSVLLGGVSLAWPGAVFFTSSWRALKNRSINLDVPIALALLVGGVAGVFNVITGRGEIYFDSLAVLVFLLLVGRFVQYRQHRRADDAVELMFSMTPTSCRLVRDDTIIEVPVEALVAGDIVEVASGEVMPADGQVTQGRSAVDEALLSGESMPVTVAVGANVFAGSLNVGQTIHVRVEATGESTRVGKLMQLVEAGVQDKPQIARLADRVGFWFLPIICCVAAVVFAAWWSAKGMSQAIDHTVALLIVTCPCVLGLATPLTIAVAIGRLSREKILVKSATALESLAHRGRILLDKTGTITRGQPRVVRYIGEDEVKALVGEIERTSRHPIGRALHDAFGEYELSGRLRATLGNVTERHDGGICASVGRKRVEIGSLTYMRDRVESIESIIPTIDLLDQAGETSVIVAVDGTVRAIIGLRDEPRDDSRQAVIAIDKLGWRPAILSGDRPAVANAVAREVDIDPLSVTANATPEQKLKIVKDCARMRRTIMVGDGVNDAAALAAADVGIAVHGGAEASLSASDVYIARPGLMPIVELLRMSRHTMFVVKRNLAISLTYNAIAGVLAAAGLMHPMLAAILMPLSAATVLGTATWSVWRYDWHGKR
jgi:Cu2+-exporting ATPase